MRLWLLDCGQTHSKDAAIRATLKERLPSNKEIDSMKFGEISELGKIHPQPVACCHAASSGC